MSAKERADLLANDLLARGMVPILTHEARAIIAQAIREAEASARNEALEEAASHLARFGCFPEASEIRNLKTKD